MTMDAMLQTTECLAAPEAACSCHSLHPWQQAAATLAAAVLVALCVAWLRYRERVVRFTASHEAQTNPNPNPNPNHSPLTLTLTLTLALTLALAPTLTLALTLALALTLTTGESNRGGRGGGGGAPQSPELTEPA